MKNFVVLAYCFIFVLGEKSPLNYSQSSGHQQSSSGYHHTQARNAGQDKFYNGARKVMTIERQTNPPLRDYRWYFNKDTGKGYAIPISRSDESPQTLYGSYPSITSSSSSRLVKKSSENLEVRPFFDPVGRRWVCPAYNFFGTTDNTQHATYATKNMKSESKPKLTGSSTGQKAEVWPISLSKAIQLDSSSDQINYNAVLQNITGIKIQNVVRASALGFNRGMQAPSAKPAFCEPELTTVSLDLPSNPSTFYYPTCTRIERCGGCCSHELLECQATEVETVKMSVIKTEIRGSDMKFVGQENVQVEKHLKCACDCRVKAEDCHPGQIYLPHECRCLCKNSNSEHVCNSRPSDRFWDPSECKCKCKTLRECSTGMIFNDEKCRCERVSFNVQAQTKVGIGN